jgi:hypothetical protein
VSADAALANSDAARSQLAAGFGNLSGAVPIEPAPNTFPDEVKGKFFQPNQDGRFSLSSARLEGIAGWQWLNDTRPEAAQPEVERLVTNSGLSLNRIDNYGGGDLYQLLSQTGDLAGFLNVVPGEGRASTIIVIWNADPRS